MGAHAGDGDEAMGLGREGAHVVVVVALLEPARRTVCLPVAHVAPHMLALVGVAPNEKVGSEGAVHEVGCNPIAHLGDLVEMACGCAPLGRCRRTKVEKKGRSSSRGTDGRMGEAVAVETMGQHEDQTTHNGAGSIRTHGDATRRWRSGGEAGCRGDDDRRIRRSQQPGARKLNPVHCATCGRRRRTVRTVKAAAQPLQPTLTHLPGVCPRVEHR